MSQRIDRISEEVWKAVSESIRNLKDPRTKKGLVSVTRCEVTGDLRYAKVYVSVLGSEDDAKDVMRGLCSAAGFLRRDVAAKVQLRYAPELIFQRDESITHGAHIAELLHKIEGKENKE